MVSLWPMKYEDTFPRRRLAEYGWAHTKIIYPEGEGEGDSWTFRDSKDTISRLLLCRHSISQSPMLFSTEMYGRHASNLNSVGVSFRFGTFSNCQLDKQMIPSVHTNRSNQEKMKHKLSLKYDSLTLTLINYRIWSSELLIINNLLTVSAWRSRPPSLWKDEEWRHIDCADILLQTC